MSTSRGRLVQAHAETVAYYSDALRSAQGRGPRDYLAQRGLAGVAEHRDWAVGYAPPGWTGLLHHLRTARFTDTEIRDAGLAVATRRGTLVDRFRDRVVLGIRDDDGDVVGLVGRCAPGGEGRAPKYLNGPHTQIFAKSQLQFGLSKAINCAAAPPRYSPKAPSTCSRSPLSTSSLLRSRRAARRCGLPRRLRWALQALAETVITAYDGDQAGRRAVGSAFSHLSPSFDSVLSASLPDGQDPASLLAGGSDSLARALRTTTPLLDRIVDDVLGGYPRLHNAEARLCALHASTRLLARLGPRGVGHQVGQVSQKLGIEPSEVTRDLLDAVAQDQSKSTARRAVSVVHRDDAPDHRHRRASL